MIQYDPMKRRISCDLSNRKEADSELPNAMMYDKHIMRRNEIIMMSWRCHEDVMKMLWWRCDDTMKNAMKKCRNDVMVHEGCMNDSILKSNHDQ